MPNVFKALSDPIFRQDVKRGVMDALNRGMVAGGLGAPVDLATMALRPFGYNIEKPVGGSEWIGDKMRQAGMVSDQRNALAEAAAGMLAPTGYADPVATARAVAGLVGAAQVAGPAQKAMFIGAGAKTWDKAAAAKAQALEAQGIDARTIWKETGTFKGADGKWRQEIDDSLAALMPANKKAADWMEGPGPADYPVGTVANVVRHDAMSAAYPDAMAIKTVLKKGQSGSYLPNAGFGEAFDLPATFKSGDYSSPETTKSVAMHELQHAIQQREGFAVGGSANEFQNIDADAINTARVIAARIQRGDSPKAAAQWVKEKLGKDWTPQIMDLAMSKELISMPSSPKEAYQRLAGEAEARATQARMHLSAKQRRELFPYDSYDVKPENLIVRLAR